MLIAPEDYQHIYAAEPKAKEAKGKDGNQSGSSEEEDQPTMLLAPQDYEHIYSGKTGAVGKARKTAPLPSPSTDEPSIPEDAPTLLIAPEDYEHIYAAKADNNSQEPTASGGKRKVKGKAKTRGKCQDVPSIPEDAPTALIVYNAINGKQPTEHKDDDDDTDEDIVDECNSSEND